MKEISEGGRAHLAHITDGADLDRLDPVDRDTLNRYAESYARWAQLEAAVEQYGLLVKQQNGFPAENPYIPIAHRYSAACSRMEGAVKKIIAQLRKAAPPPVLIGEEDEELDRQFGGLDLSAEQDHA